MFKQLNKAAERPKGRFGIAKPASVASPSNTSSRTESGPGTGGNSNSSSNSGNSSNIGGSADGFSMDMPRVTEQGMTARDESEGASGSSGVSSVGRRKVKSNTSAGGVPLPLILLAGAVGGGLALVGAITRSFQRKQLPEADVQSESHSRNATAKTRGTFKEASDETAVGSCNGPECNCVVSEEEWEQRIEALREQLRAEQRQHVEELMLEAEKRLASRTGTHTVGKAGGGGGGVVGAWSGMSKDATSEVKGLVKKELEGPLQLMRTLADKAASGVESVGDAAKEVRGTVAALGVRMEAMEEKVEGLDERVETSEGAVSLLRAQRKEDQSALKEQREGDLKGLKGQLDGQREELTGLKGQVEGPLKGQLEECRRLCAEAREEVRKGCEGLEGKVGGLEGGWRKELAELSDAVRGLQGRVEEEGKRVAMLEKAVEEAGGLQKVGGEEIGRVSGGLGEVREEMKGVRKETGDVREEVQRVQGVLKEELEVLAEKVRAGVEGTALVEQRLSTMLEGVKKELEEGGKGRLKEVGDELERLRLKQVAVQEELKGIPVLQEELREAQQQREKHEKAANEEAARASEEMKGGMMVALGEVEKKLSEGLEGCRKEVKETELRLEACFKGDFQDLELRLETESKTRVEQEQKLLASLGRTGVRVEQWEKELAEQMLEKGALEALDEKLGGALIRLTAVEQEQQHQKQEQQEQKQEQQQQKQALLAQSEAHSKLLAQSQQLQMKALGSRGVAAAVGDGGGEASGNGSSTGDRDTVLLDRGSSGGVSTEGVSADSSSVDALAEVRSQVTPVEGRVEALSRDMELVHLGLASLRKGSGGVMSSDGAASDGTDRGIGVGLNGKSVEEVCEGIVARVTVEKWEGAVEGIRAEVKEARAEVGGVRADLGGVKADMGVLREEVEEAKGGVVQLKAEARSTSHSVGDLGSQAEKLWAAVERLRQEESQLKVQGVEGIAALEKALSQFKGETAVAVESLAALEKVVTEFKGETGITLADLDKAVKELKGETNVALADLEKVVTEFKGETGVALEGVAAELSGVKEQCKRGLDETAKLSVDCEERFGAVQGRVERVEGGGKEMRAELVRAEGEWRREVEAGKVLLGEQAKRMMGEVQALREESDKRQDHVNACLVDLEEHMGRADEVVGVLQGRVDATEGASVEMEARVEKGEADIVSLFEKVEETAVAVLALEERVKGAKQREDERAGEEELRKFDEEQRWGELEENLGALGQRLEGQEGNLEAAGQRLAGLEEGLRQAEEERSSSAQRMLGSLQGDVRRLVEKLEAVVREEQAEVRKEMGDSVSTLSLSLTRADQKWSEKHEQLFAAVEDCTKDIRSTIAALEESREQMQQLDADVSIMAANVGGLQSTIAEKKQRGKILRWNTTSRAGGGDNIPASGSSASESSTPRAPGTFVPPALDTSPHSRSMELDKKRTAGWFSRKDNSGKDATPSSSAAPSDVSDTF